MRSVEHPPMNRGKQKKLIRREEEKRNVQRKIHGKTETVGITDFFLISGSRDSLGLIMMSVLGFSDIILHSYNKFSFTLFSLCFCYLPSKESHLHAYVYFCSLVIYILIRSWMWQRFKAENKKQYGHEKKHFPPWKNKTIN